MKPFATSFCHIVRLALTPTVQRPRCVSNTVNASGYEMWFWMSPNLLGASEEVDRQADGQNRRGHGEIGNVS